MAYSVEPFIGLSRLFKENGTSAEAVRVMEEGNFAVLHHLWKGAKPFGANEMVAFDVIRFDVEGKIAEHWDAMMPNTPLNPSDRTLIEGEKEIIDLDKTESRENQLIKLVDVLINGSQEEAGKAVMENFQPDYKQHNPFSADGLEGFMAAMPTEQWVYQKQHKVIAEGNFVLSISEGTYKEFTQLIMIYFALKMAKLWNIGM